MHTLRKHAFAAALASAFFASAAAAAPYPTHDTPKARDLGLAHEAKVTVRIGLKFRNSDEMSALMQQRYTKGGPP
jgi:hypothetical protein